MYCNCGFNDEMKVRRVTRDKKLAGIWHYCPGCGRIEWTYKTSRLIEEAKIERETLVTD